MSWRFCFYVDYVLSELYFFIHNNYSMIYFSLIVLEAILLPIMLKSSPGTNQNNEWGRGFLSKVTKD